ncbi:RNA polymerase sigma factor [Chitinophaga sp. CF418]|uniref:RNA polymerase sigma factor n=1 Tax=Chitinophaga sp. CF418 TaxID=1855287 RepID=UPI0009208C69|nr:RNA polymerase sigma factor [Chitinophaga sp. CF418]SHN46020.1 RNA polymerase sigma-70 factor, ECF subfamily [Chitinophaga sp. CF418]
MYEQYYGYAFKIVFRYIYRYENAKDVVNDGFVKVFTRFDKFSCEESEDQEKMLMGWIRKIMVNTAIDELRRKNMIPEIGGIPEEVWEVPDVGQSAEQKLYYKELIVLVKELPPSYQVVFNMYVIDGFSHQEIADKLNVSIGTSKSNLAKARAYLQKKLNTDIPEIDVCSS